MTLIAFDQFGTITRFYCFRENKLEYMAMQVNALIALQNQGLNWLN